MYRLGVWVVSVLIVILYINQEATATAISSIQTKLNLKTAL